MRDIILKIAGGTRHADSARWSAACVRGFWPLAAPFLILSCEPRWELAAVAACWSVLALPGVLAVNLFFPPDHPLGRGVGRLSVASIGGLLVFGAVSWPACLLHWRLSTALGLYAVTYVVCVVVLVRCLIRGSPASATDDPWPKVENSLGVPKWTALIVVLGIAVFMAGVALATVQTQDPFRTPGFYAARKYWLHGTVLGAVSSLLVSLVLLLGLRRRRSPAPGPARAATRRSARKRARRRATESSSGAAPTGSWSVIFLWAAVAGLSWHAMTVAYMMPTDDFPSPHRPPWNSDDVTYVSQAVDARFGLPMGKYESSIGGAVGLSRANLSPLVAPLVGAVSWATGVECAALHHAVMRPLVILTGISALAGLLMVLFRGHRWAVPLGLLVVLLIIGKSWEYERSMVEFTIWRAMQTKSVHLWMVHPLQLAALLLLTFRPNKRHLLLGAAVALVGHLVHPFSTILGMTWATTTAGAAALAKRNALPKVLLLVAIYGLLGGTYYTVSKRPLENRVPSDGRVSGEPELTRDLVRVDDQAIRRHDPRILFGWNMVFNLGALAIPMVLAAGRRHREFLLPGLLGALTVVGCNSAFLGELINKALPISILWRFRWALPGLALAAVVSFILFRAFLVLMRRPDHTTTPTRSLLASLAVVGLFIGMLSNSSGYAMKAGPPPKQLSKFSNDVHGLVDLLGGPQAAPFLWGPRTVTRELPQLMPHIRLVLSRRMLVLPVEHPDFRRVVFRTRDVFYVPARGFRGGKAPQDVHLATALRQLNALYPIDHFVLDYGTGRGAQGARVLQGAGWQRVGRSGGYEVWRKPAP